MPSIEVLAAMLKKLVGHRAEPHRLAVCAPLRELAGVNGEAQHMAGYIIRRYLQEQIGSIVGSYLIEGVYVQADTIRRALNILLGLDGRHEWAEVRRYEVIALLGIYCSVDKWRKGPEMELMLILARHLIVSQKPVAS
jgi:hypothetical protein